MEVLDTSIANVALPYMAGGLAASVDDASWVLTSYLVANAVVLPISGWLSIRFGRKRFYMACVVIFTVSSFLCGIAPSLGMLILFRVIQGAGGGGLQPVSQAILRDTFPPEQLGTAFAVYGMVVVLAPAIGPTIGGWITDNYQWRWIFYMNVPVGMLSLLLVSRLIEDPDLSHRAAKEGLRGHLSIDYIGIGLLALCLGALQVVLDKGQEDDWFHSPMIATLAVIFPVALVLFIAWELTRSKPVMDLRMFKNRNFAAAAAMIFAYGVQVYGMTVFTPQYVQAFMGYDAELAGMTQLPGALLLIVLMPLTARLVRRIEARWLIALGFLLSALALVPCHHQPRSSDRFSHRRHVPRLAIGRPRAAVRSDQHRLVCWRPGRKRRRGFWNDQSAAQHRRKRGHLDGRDDDSAARAVPSGRTQRACDSRATGLSQRDERLERGPLSSRSQPASSSDVKLPCASTTP